MTKNIKPMTVKRTIHILEKNINLGFTHENFTNTAQLIKTLSCRMDPLDVDMLEAFWRDSYTDSVDPKTLKTVCKQLEHKYRNTNL